MFCDLDSVVFIPAITLPTRASLTCTIKSLCDFTTALPTGGTAIKELAPYRIQPAK